MKTIQKYTLLFGSVAIIMLFFITTACGGGKKKPNISGIKAEVVIKRFDRDLLEVLKKGAEPADLKSLAEKYPEFYDKYFVHLVNLAHPEDPNFRQLLLDFYHTHGITDLFKDTDAAFADLSWFEKEVNLAFRYYKYYFPDKPVPKIITFTFGFNNRVTPGDTMIGIALDQYLGRDYPGYDFVMEEYRKVSRDKGYMTAEMLRGFATVEYPGNGPRNSLMEEMIYQGKTLYFTSLLMPDAPDSVLMGYTRVQMDFTNKNEFNIWSYVLSNEMLFSKDLRQIKKYMDEAPFSPGMPRETPGRVLCWTGWRIVQNYMKRNPGITLEQLMLNNNYQEILDKSKYRPRQ